MPLGANFLLPKCATPRQGSTSSLPDTVSHVEVGDIYAKQHGCLASSSRNSKYTPVTELGLMVDATNLNMRSRMHRPLPSIPPPSPTGISRSSCRSYRPLPSPPLTPPHSAIEEEVDFQRTLNEPIMATSSRSSLPPPPYKPRPMLSPIFISNDPVPLARVSPDPFTNSFYPPEPPTPRTAKQKRISKLRRHFGEAIPEDEVQDAIQDAAGSKAGSPEKLGELGGHRDRGWLGAAILAVGKVYDSPSDDGSNSGSSRASLDEDNDFYSWTIENGSDSHHGPGNRWVREKKGRRWEEPDYGKIINALRAL